jgi:hypothetical protein
MVAANYTDDGGYKRSSGFDQTKLSVRHTYDGEGFSTDTIFSGADLDQDTAISPSLSSASTSRKISHCRLNKNDDGSTRRLWSRYIDQRSRTGNSAKFLQEYMFDLVCVPVFLTTLDLVCVPAFKNVCVGYFLFGNDESYNGRIRR